MTDEAMVDVHAVAMFLNLHPSTVYSYAHSGDIPAHKIGGRWRFLLSEIRGHVTKPAHDPWVRRVNRAQRSWDRRGNA
jgi:excisionase family DNA binding protein